MANTVPTSFYLTSRDREMLEELKQRHGINRSSVIRLALQRLHASSEERNNRLLEIAEEIKQLV